METGDRKLNEVKKVTDMAYVPVIMADGSIGQIAKSDLASVVAGVISPFRDHGNKDSSFDLNDFKKNGMVYGVGMINAPISEATNVICVCFRYANVMARQMAKKYAGENIYGTQ